MAKHVYFKDYINMSKPSSTISAFILFKQVNIWELVCIGEHAY